jgi:hypothetical protein
MVAVLKGLFSISQPNQRKGVLIIVINWIRMLIFIEMLIHNLFDSILEGHCNIDLWRSSHSGIQPKQGEKNVTTLDWMNSSTFSKYLAFTDTRTLRIFFSRGERFLIGWERRVSEEATAGISIYENI